jgi:hypothetical protein
LAKTGRDTSAAWQCDSLNREIPRFQQEDPSILGQNRRLAAVFHGTGFGPLALRALGALWDPAKREYVQMELASNLRDRQGHLDPDTAIFFGVGMMVPGLFSRLGVTQAPEAVPGGGIVKAVSGKPVAAAKPADAVEVMPVSAAPGDLVYLRTKTSSWDHLTNVFAGFDDVGKFIFGILHLPPEYVVSATKIAVGNRLRVEFLVEGGRDVIEGTVKRVVLGPNKSMLEGHQLVLDRVKTSSGSMLEEFELNTLDMRNVTVL